MRLPPPFQGGVALWAGGCVPQCEVSLVLHTRLTPPFQGGVVFPSVSGLLTLCG